jgi:hypothetical protein
MPVADSPEHLPGTADDEFKANPFSGFSYVHGGFMGQEEQGP